MLGPQGGVLQNVILILHPLINTLPLCVHTQIVTKYLRWLAVKKIVAFSGAECTGIAF